MADLARRPPPPFRIGCPMTPLHYLLLAAMLATLGVLVVGVVGFLRGGAFNEKYGNRLMRARVILQFVALVLLAILFLAH